MAKRAQRLGGADAPGAEMAQPQTAPQSLEDRLRPWIDQGEYVIPLVIALMVWSAGWVDLLAYTSPANPIIFGRYAPGFFAVLVAYTLGFGVWFWLIGTLKGLQFLRQGIAFVQRRPWLYVLAWLGFGVIIWSMFSVSYWTALPLLEVAVLVLMLLFTALVLLAKPTPDAPFQPWRKAALGLLAALLLFEATLQGLARFNLAPLENTSGIAAPYGRVYQTSEGAANATTNRYGWYYPDFRLQPGERRIILSGDTFVQALQVPLEAHMGQALERRLSGDAQATEVLAQGQLGYGASMFLNPIMAPYIWEPLEPDEIVVFFHLANDFQLADKAADPRPRFVVGDDGKPVVLDEDFAYWHILAHEVIKGHDPVNPIRTALSHVLSLQWMMNLAEDRLGFGRPSFVPFSFRSSEAEPFGPASYLFEPAPGAEAVQAYGLTAAQVRDFAREMSAQGVAVRLVTIPFFPQAALTAGGATGWSPTFAEYDSLAPERALESAAREAGVPFLGMGRYMQASGADADTIRSLFLNDGQGHLSEAGHAYFAEAIFNCFYSSSPTPNSAGCLTQGQ